MAAREKKTTGNKQLGDSKDLTKGAGVTEIKKEVGASVSEFKKENEKQKGNLNKDGTPIKRSVGRPRTKIYPEKTNTTSKKCVSVPGKTPKSDSVVGNSVSGKTSKSDLSTEKGSKSDLLVRNSVSAKLSKNDVTATKTLKGESVVSKTSKSDSGVGNSVSGKSSKSESVSGKTSKSDLVPQKTTRTRSTSLPGVFLKPSPSPKVKRKYTSFKFGSLNSESRNGIRSRSGPYVTRSDSPVRILRNGKRRKLAGPSFEELGKPLERRRRKRSMIVGVLDKKKSPSERSFWDSPKVENGKMKCGSNGNIKVHGVCSDGMKSEGNLSQESQGSNCTEGDQTEADNNLGKSISYKIAALIKRGKVTEILQKISAVRGERASQANSTQAASKETNASSELGEKDITDTNSNLCGMESACEPIENSPVEETIIKKSTAADKKTLQSDTKDTKENVSHSDVPAHKDIVPKVETNSDKIDNDKNLASVSVSELNSEKCNLIVNLSDVASSENKKSTEILRVAVESINCDKKDLGLQNCDQKCASVKKDEVKVASSFDEELDSLVKCLDENEKSLLNDIEQCVDVSSKVENGSSFNVVEGSKDSKSSLQESFSIVDSKHVETSGSEVNSNNIECKVEDLTERETEEILENGSKIRRSMRSSIPKTRAALLQCLTPRGRSPKGDPTIKQESDSPALTEDDSTLDGFEFELNSKDQVDERENEIKKNTCKKRKTCEEDNVVLVEKMPKNDKVEFDNLGKQEENLEVKGKEILQNGKSTTDDLKMDEENKIVESKIAKEKIELPTGKNIKEENAGKKEDKKVQLENKLFIETVIPKQEILTASDTCKLEESTQCAVEKSELLSKEVVSTIESSKCEDKEIKCDIPQLQVENTSENVKMKEAVFSKDVEVEDVKMKEAVFSEDVKVEDAKMKKDSSCMDIEMSKDIVSEDIEMSKDGVNEDIEMSKGSPCVDIEMSKGSPCVDIEMVKGITSADIEMMKDITSADIDMVKNSINPDIELTGIDSCVHIEVKKDDFPGDFELPKECKDMDMIKDVHRIDVPCLITGTEVANVASCMGLIKDTITNDASCMGLMKDTLTNDASFTESIKDSIIESLPCSSTGTHNSSSICTTSDEVKTTDSSYVARMQSNSCEADPAEKLNTLELKPEIEACVQETQKSEDSCKMLETGSKNKDTGSLNEFKKCEVHIENTNSFSVKLQETKSEDNKECIETLKDEEKNHNEGQESATESSLPEKVVNTAFDLEELKSRDGLESESSQNGDLSNDSNRCKIMSDSESTNEAENRSSTNDKLSEDSTTLDDCEMMKALDPIQDVISSLVEAVSLAVENEDAVNSVSVNELDNLEVTKETECMNDAEPSTSKFSESSTKSAVNEEVSPEDQAIKESILSALGLQSLEAAQTKATSGRSKLGYSKAYTGTLKTVIKLQRSPEKRGKSSLKMVFKHDKGNRNTNSEPSPGSGEAELEPDDVLSKDRVEYKIKEVDGDVEPLGDPTNFGVGNRKCLKPSFTYRSYFDLSTNSPFLTENASVEENVDKDAANKDDGKASVKQSGNLVIPEKSSSFSIHPGRLCSDVCSYCFGKFGSLDTPCHIAQLKSSERQQKILETETHLTADSCLCDACYRHVDRKANCPSYKVNRKRHQRSNTAFKSPCCVQGCSQPAHHHVRRKWLLKLKRSIAKKVTIDMDKQPQHLPFPLCSQHYYWVDYFMVCGICKRRLTRNHMYPLGPEVHDLNSALAEDGIPVILNDKLFLCKLCRYFSSLCLKYKDRSLLTANHKVFFEDYRRRILHYNDIEIMDTEEASEPITLPPKAKRRKTKNNEEEKVDGSKNKGECGDTEKLSGATGDDLDAVGDLNRAGASTPMIDYSSLAFPSTSTADLKSSMKTPKLRVKLGNGTGSTSDSRNSSPADNGVSKSFYPGQEELPMCASFAFHENSNSTDTSPSKKKGDWEQCTASIQFNRDTKKLFQELQRPYGNHSSFFRHLVLLEKYWRAGELTLSSTASSKASGYINSVSNRVRAFEGHSTPVSTATFVPPLAPSLSVIPVQQQPPVPVIDLPLRRGGILPPTCNASSRPVTVTPISCTIAASRPLTIISSTPSPIAITRTTSSSPATTLTPTQPARKIVIDSKSVMGGSFTKNKHIPNILQVTTGGKSFSLVPNAAQLRQLQALKQQQQQQQQQQQHHHLHQRHMPSTSSSSTNFVPKICDVRSLALDKGIKLWNKSELDVIPRPAKLQQSQPKLSVTILPKPSGTSGIRSNTPVNIAPKPTTIVTPTGIILSRNPDISVSSVPLRRDDSSSC